MKNPQNRDRMIIPTFSSRINQEILLKEVEEVSSQHQRSHRSILVYGI